MRGYKGECMEIVVDDRTFVIGLCELFRQEMQSYEVASLLPLAETACEALGLPPAMVPVEGYYASSEALQRFFQLIRALQNADMRGVSHSSGVNAIEQLRRVFTSPAMGRAEESDRVLPRTSSPFGEALRILSEWSIDGLSRLTRQLVKNDDEGLMAVAGITGDPIAICVARESVALMAEVELAEMDMPHFTWGVSESVARVAARFVSTLAETTGIMLPKPEANASQVYGQAARDAELIGRCILIGERFGNPYPYYHWYIDARNEALVVKDFWSNAVWTTDSIRHMPVHHRPESGAVIEAPNIGNEPADGGIGLVPKNRKQRTKKGWFGHLFKRRK
jgi:hypothetical protein